uniref:SdrD B-like domain-containing protein n=1 Tax=Maribacter antarcticus TaxID=505250 RepID=UPI00047E173F
QATTEYTVTVTSSGGCSDEDSGTVNVTAKITIGDFVFDDMNKDGIQDDEDTGINGVTVKLFQCDSYGNANGELVETYVTSNNPHTGEPGYYSFELCQNSGSYYLIFEDIPDGYEFTSQGMGDIALDSDANNEGVTSCFDVTDKDNTTIDTGLVSETCAVRIGNKVSPRDSSDVYTARNSDTACIGDNLYLSLFLHEENLANYNSYNGSDFQGWSFTYEFPNGKVFTQGDFAEQSYRTRQYPITEQDFGSYKVTFVNPNGETGIIRFELSLAPECKTDGTRKSYSNDIGMVYPVPALASTELNIVVNTENQSVDNNGDEDTSVYGLSARLPQTKETVTAMLYGTNGKIVAPARTFEVNKGRTVLKYPLSNLATGNYILLISGKDWSDSKQIIIK